MTNSEKVVTLLQTLLTRRERDRSPVRPARVLGRNQDGTERILRTDAACVTRGGADNHYAGTIVLQPTGALNRSGSGAGTSETIGAGALWVERLEPAELHRGQTAVEVLVIGRGFDTATWIDFLLPAVDDVLALNQDLTVQSVTLVDSETLLLQVDVATGARLFSTAPITFGRQAGATPMSTSGEPRQLGRQGYKADAYAVAAALSAPRYFAFLAPDDLVAAIYGTDGAWIADRGSLTATAELPSAENGVLIAQDSAHHVSPGSLAWRSGDNELTVWDVAAAVTYTYTGADAWCSPPVYHGGKLWWVEGPATEIEPDTGEAIFTLRSASCDLSGPETVTSALFSMVLQSWDLGPAARVAASSGGLLFATQWRDNINEEAAGAAGARFNYSSTGAATAEGAAIDLAQGLPAGSSSVGLSAPSNTLRSLEDTLGAVSAPRWPTTGAWALEEGFGMALNAAVTANGTTALLYGYAPGGEVAIVIEAPATAASGAPQARTEVSPHPDHELLPLLLFFME